ncbi:MAG TPA: glucose-1-phosphate adenylyltransferase subunit GlgD [Ruminiclostridium sp.]|jgi:glucose-1-phosphate adenylyltransferase|nr:glucose-1-phosphate adenylyltransferase subunit GlgD [Ruminiclostridium sp.]
MKSAMGIILTGGMNNRLKELSIERSIAAVPFGGKYRAIDFTLSNMVNSGITNVGVLTQYNIRSLMDHLGSGKEWDLDRKKDGLFIFPPFLSEFGTGWYKGSADAMYNNLGYFERSKEEFVVIGQGYAVYNMDYTPMLEQHIQTEADITIACRNMSDFSSDDQKLLGIVEINSEGRITDFMEKPLHPKNIMGSTGVYILSKKLLIELLQESAAKSQYEFVQDIIVRNTDKLKIHAYIFNSYWRPLSNIQLYYRANMELLNPRVRQELLMDRKKIFTKVKDEAPAKYNEEADVRNSIIADGCIIEGHVENSVLFRGVRIMKGAVIKNSIVMQGSTVDQNVTLHHCILDKGVAITEGKTLVGDSEWPLIVGKNVKV